MARKLWDKKELITLKNNWFNGSKQELLSLFTDRTWLSIKSMARILKLKRNVYSPFINTRKYPSKVYKLLENTFEAYYWVGFLMADGYIYKNNRLILSLAVLDSDHILKFSDFIQYKFVKDTSYISNGKRFFHKRISIMDTYLVPKLIKKFNFKSRKTYNPPDALNIKNNDLFLSFLIGFIDGDGCLHPLYNRKDYILKIKLHRTWKKVLYNWIDRLYQIVNIKGKWGHNFNVKINNNGYVRVNISNGEVLAFLKQTILKLNLPVLQRKWNGVPTTFSTVYSDSALLKNKIRHLLKKGMRITDISKKLKVSLGYISLIKHNKR